MSAIPSNLARVPNLLASRIVLGSIQGTNRDILRLQVQLSTGLRVNRASDDPLATSAISRLDDIIERRDQRLRNLSHADAVLNNVDAALGDATSLLIEAKGIALSQIGVGSDAATRETQAEVIDAMLNQMMNIGNRKFQDVRLFGGGATAGDPITSRLGAVRYSGTGSGLVTDLGLSRDLRVTMSGDDAFGAFSARVGGARDLDPGLVGNTRLVDLDGANGLGVRLGTVSVDVGGTDVEVDLTEADHVQDVIDALNAGIQGVDPGAVVQIDAATGHGIEIIPSGGVTVTISDIAGEATASDLGLVGAFSGPGGGTGAELNARLTPVTELAALSGLTLPLGTIRVTNAGQSREIDLSSATTIQDITNAVQGVDLGIRAVIAESGDRLDFINELSGASMSIAEVGGGSTATELGVRSFADTTRLADFNDGRGVEIRSGSLDPVSGAPDPDADLDFRVTLKDGRTFDVDLAGAETVQDVRDLTNAAASAAGVGVPADFQMRLASDGNGLWLEDNTAGTTVSVTALNGSNAPRQLGILGSSTGAVLAGEDSATVAVDGTFSHLIALRDALRADDEFGITLAGEKLDTDIDRLARSRGENGVRSRRVVDAITREDDLRIQEIGLRSEVQDLDFTEAAIRFATLQQQLQAGLSTAGRVTSLSLLDFLG